MPRIDPITGVSVMTWAEFVNAEATRENKEPHEWLNDLHEQLEEQRQEDIRQLREGALAFMRRLDEYDDEAIYGIDEVLEIIEVTTSSALARDSAQSVTARVRCKDGSILVLKAWEWHSSGNFYEPPDWDGDITEVREEKSESATQEP